MKREFIKIAPNCDIDIVPMPEDEAMDKLRFYYREIGCDCVDIVDATDFLPPGYAIIVDDNGLYNGNPQINPLASLLYGMRQHGQPLVGTVLIGKDVEMVDGLDTVGLDDEEVKLVLDALAQAAKVLLNMA